MDTHSVAKLFNEMAGEYDDLRDKWYPHFFKVVDQTLRQFLHAKPEEKALDVGCGTGLQTSLLHSLGYEVVGMDIAEDLIACAKQKFAADDRGVSFRVASAEAIPFPSAHFDVVICCGGVLGFITDYRQAFSEIARVLKAGGACILEVDNRWNLDLLWGLIDSLSGGYLGYEQSPSTAWRNLIQSPTKGIQLQYPFEMHDGTYQTMHVHLFTPTEVKEILGTVGFEVQTIIGIHSVSNLIPSTWMASPKLGSWFRRFADPLLWLDQKVSSRVPFRSLGNSQLFVLTRSRS
jgi:MPBQ/MSBQ methyltransferase